MSAGPAGRPVNRSLADKVKQPLRRLRSDYRSLTAPLRGLPAVLIIGAQKGGTTSLFNYLIRHPDVMAPLTKEIHYFDIHYARGDRWYRGRFPYSHQLRGGRLTLDASPYYLAHPQAPERAARLLPGVKLLALLRNPVDRALSHYQHEVRAGRERLSFAEAIAEEPGRMAGEEERLVSDPGYYSHAHHRYSYLHRGRYADQLSRWARHFPREQMLVVQSEAFFRDPAGTTDTVQRFLGLRPHRLERYDTFYQGGYGQEMDPDLRARLSTHFEAPNRQLYRWLGEDYDWL